MRIVAVIGTILMFSAFSAHAQDAAQFRTKGFGLETCESYVQASEEGSNRLVGYRSWMNGYVSGVNAARTDVYDLAGPVELNGLMRIAEAYCQNNTNEPFVAAAAAVLGTLNPIALEAAPEMVTAGSGENSVEMAKETLRDVQRLLKEAGHYGGPIDGLYGPGTSSALESYQKANGIPVNGVPDQRTLISLATSG